MYLDNSATTPVDPQVLDAMLPHFRDRFGNAASRNHRFGWDAEKAVEQAREQVATVIGASPKEIVFTSGATESDNIAMKGIAHMYRDRGNHIITQATEHKAILDPGKYLEQEGFEVTYLPVTQTGRIDLDQLRTTITDKTILVSIMTANNEIGTIQPIAEIGAICKEKDIVFHTDACQAYGKIPIDVEAMGIDLLSCSAHKLYGPKGVGALYVRRKNPRIRRPEPVLHGGGHERGIRSGTLNVPGIVGFGKAAELCREVLGAEARQIASLRDRLWAGFSRELDDIYRNGDADHALPSILNVSFAYVEGESLMMTVDDIAVSSGSACTSASLEPSYVLKAIGVGDDLAHCSIRFSIGRFNTEAEIDYCVDRFAAGVRKLREMSPLYEMAKEEAARAKTR
ncbi:MAG: IscS subfamily cysteine desulfurase [Phycisphaerae bacterium]|nr:IscS subfamily cysteine desulfurase [Phycisphaerae bacterium]